MGQYYKPILLDEKKNKPLAWVYSHEIKTKFTQDGKSFMAGCGLKLIEHSWIKNPFVRTIEALLIFGGAWHKQPIVWAGDYAENPNGGESLYSQCENDNKIKPRKRSIAAKYRYIVNHTKKQFVDKTKLCPNSDGWRIHPLPLLTCIGNGQGGGDYFGKDPNELIGSWAFDVISIETEIPKGFKELIFDLEF